jgi:hypothetical protein
LYNFRGNQSDELNVDQNEVVVVLDMSDTDGWWKARTRDGTEGMVPHNYLLLL